jgi:hypothetical protein
VAIRVCKSVSRQVKGGWSMKTKSMIWAAAPFAEGETT